MNFLEEISIQCPYCGEQIGILVDCSIESQEYIEDCQVCCRPISMAIRVSDRRVLDVRASREDD